jgi:hypothetical protein
MQRRKGGGKAMGASTASTAVATMAETVGQDFERMMGKTGGPSERDMKDMAKKLNLIKQTSTTVAAATACAAGEGARYTSGRFAARDRLEAAQGEHDDNEPPTKRRGSTKSARDAEKVMRSYVAAKDQANDENQNPNASLKVSVRSSPPAPPRRAAHRPAMRAPPHAATFTRPSHHPTHARLIISTRPSRSPPSASALSPARASPKAGRRPRFQNQNPGGRSSAATRLASSWRRQRIR